MSDMLTEEAVGPLPHVDPLHSKKWFLPAVTALGIVYGDIGTSPLYAFQVALGATGHESPTRGDVLGVVSLIFWAIILIVAIKYVTVVMRADNEGEGGILALLSLVAWRGQKRRRGVPILIVLGIAGAAFIYGDGLITPAISVLSAMEGLDVAAPGLKHWILPVTVAILIALFAVQSQGTGTIGRWFGPIMIVWFIVIGLLGLTAIVHQPAILAAVNPYYAVALFLHGGRTIVAVIGAAFLALTGAEALYADMGHVGAGAIRRGLVRAGPSGFGAVLFRTRRSHPVQSRRGGESVFQSGPDLGGFAVGAAGRPCDDHRQRGVDQRCVLANTAGDPDAPVAAIGDSVDVG